MMTAQQIREKIAAAGLKVTLQRVAVLEALTSRSDHPTADEVIRYLQERYPGIATGTVYKTLDTFVNKGIVEKVKVDSDKMRYDAFTDKHHHLYSVDDNEIGDYYDKELDELLQDYFRKKDIPNFEIHDLKLQIVGKFKK